MVGAGAISPGAGTHPQDIGNLNGQTSSLSLTHRRLYHLRQFDQEATHMQGIRNDLFPALVPGDPRGLTPAFSDRLNEALVNSGVLVFKEAHLDDAEHLRLSGCLGECELHPIEEIRSSIVPELILLRADGVGSDHPRAGDTVGRIPWHSDLTYTAAPPRAAVLRALVVPPVGGQTAFINTARVFRELPPALRKQTLGRNVRHSFERSASLQIEEAAKAGATSLREMPRFESVVHPLVSSHPISGQPVLTISPEFVDVVVGMPEEDSTELLNELIAFATAERFVYRHEWTEGDVVIWDNAQTIHAALGHERRYSRMMMRTTIGGGPLVPFSGVR